MNLQKRLIFYSLKRLSPFQFYEAMGNNNPVAYDDRSNTWAVVCYYDAQSILGDYTHFLQLFHQQSSIICRKKEKR